MTKGFKKGDFIVPLPCQERWKDEYPTYPDSMEEHVGQVGIATDFDYQSEKLSRCVLVEFSRLGKREDTDSWYYKPEWVRFATEEEIRAHKFILAVRST